MVCVSSKWCKQWQSTRRPSFGKALCCVFSRHVPAELNTKLAGPIQHSGQDAWLCGSDEVLLAQRGIGDPAETTASVHAPSNTSVLSSFFHRAAEEDVDTATPGDRAESFRVTNQSDNTSGLKIGEHHHFLADLRAALPHTQASPALMKLGMLEAEMFLHKVLTPGGGLHANAGLSNIDDKDGILLADQVDQSMRLNFFGRSRVWRRSGQACTCATSGGCSCSSTVA